MPNLSARPWLNKSYWFCRDALPGRLKTTARLKRVGKIYGKGSQIVIYKQCRASSTPINAKTPCQGVSTCVQIKRREKEDIP